MAAALLLCSFASFAEGDSRVFYDAFESAGKEGLPNGWQYHSYQQEYCYDPTASSAEVVSCGDEHGSALHISVTKDDDAAVYRTVRVEPSSTYRISCYIKTSGVVCDAPDNQGEPSGANIALREIIVRSRGVLGDSDWQLVELVGVTSATQKELVVSCRVGGYSSVARGEAWFDEFTVEKLSSYNGETVNFFAGSASSDDGDDTDGEKIVSGDKGFGAMVFVIVALTLALTAGLVALCVSARKKDEAIVEDKSAASSERERRRDKLEAIKGRSIFDMKADLLPASRDNKLHFVKLDWIFVTVLTLVYAFIALFRLGTTCFPTSSWSANKGESVTITFESPVTITKIWQNSGVSQCKYTVSSDKGDIVTVDEAYGVMYRWKEYSAANVGEVTSVTITVNGGDSGRPKEADLVFNELVFFDADNNIIKVASAGGAEALFDEQDTVPGYPSYYTGMYFDEIYHARTAYEHINNLNVYEWTHPPLGKLLISVGIMIFGMNPFGWRIIGTLLGIVMVPLMYCFAKRLVKRPELCLLAAGLLTFDFMHFTQTRIATVDVFALFFTLLMTYYMYQFLCTDVGDDIKAMLKPLALSGLFFGLGCACKWTCIYTGAALAVMFFGKLILLGIRSRKLAESDERHADLPRKFGSRAIRLCGWCVLFFIVLPALIYCAAYCRYYTAQWKPAEQARILMEEPERADTAEEVKLTLNEAANTYIGGVIQNQKDMYGYHSKLTSDHSASSPWWMWIYNLRPTWFYVSYVPTYTVTFKDWDGAVLQTQTVNYGGSAKTPEAPARPGYTFAGWQGDYTDVTCNTTVTAAYTEGGSEVGSSVTKEAVTAPAPDRRIGTISTFGNPAVWNLCFIGTLALIVSLIFHRRRLTMEAAFLFICMASSLLPWVMVTRSTYAYHYFSTVPYIILASVYLLKYVEDITAFRAEEDGETAFRKFIPKIKYIWLAAAVVLFALFYPVISGVEAPETYIHLLEWVPFFKRQISNSAGEVKRTLRMGWTFLSYGS